MSTILTNAHICLFCGQPIEESHADRVPYYECTCSDAVNDRLIREKIKELEKTRPKPKFRIEQKKVLYPIIENE